MFLVFLVVAALVLLWGIGTYNGLIALRNQVANTLKQVDVQLKRRHDLIPNLVNAVKGHMSFEQSTLEAVVTARSRAMSASGVAAQAQAEGALTQALGRFFALAEQYPDLKSSQNVMQLQGELSATEGAIGQARQLYNDTATRYNTKQQQVPTNFIASLAGMTPSPLWEIDVAAEREVPKVDLSLPDRPPPQ